ncbi:LysR family transcriptional regulator [Pararhizobium sp. A13]|uniref:LysR family transcriptional regulator n=1 Tax=Pararhizobium sp. A13 TaxID=3133975 RepID=UPI00311B341B
MNSSRIPPFVALRAVASVARLQSVTKAAKELNVSHSAVSHHIKAVEGWFGRSLFRRDGRGISPGEDAVTLGQAVEDALAQLSQSCAEIRRKGEGPDLTIAVIPSFASWWLVPKLQGFQCRYPNVRLHLVYAVPGISLEGADIVIQAHKGVVEIPSNHVAVRLMCGVTYPACSRVYFEKANERVDLLTIDSSELLHDETMDVWAQWMRAAGRVTFAPDRGPIYQDFNLLAAAIFAGQGVAQCPVALFEREIQSGSLILLSDRPENEDKSYWMTLRRPDKPACRHFGDWTTSFTDLGA